MNGIQATGAVHYLRSVATTRATFAAQCNREQQAEWLAADLIEQQAAEIERLRVDVERYRFVRTADKVGISAEAARDPVLYDAAIDAAMKRKRDE